MRQVRERLFLGDITDAYTVLQSPKPKVTHMLSMLADELLASLQNSAPGNLCSLVTMGSPPADAKSPQQSPGKAGIEGGGRQALVRKAVPLKDMETENLLDHLESCLQFIEEGRRASGGAVLVHCQAGISRSASVVTAYLMRTEKLSLIYALASLREVSDGVCPNEGFMDQLRMFEEMGFRVDHQSPIYKHYRRAHVTGGSFRCVPGRGWVSFFEYLNNAVKGGSLRRSGFMNHVHNVAPPVVKRKKAGEELQGMSLKTPTGGPPFRTRVARLWRRGREPT